MKNLEELRFQIDDIDKSIVKLFERRMNIVSKVGEIKRENKLPILNTQREEEVIKKNVNYLKDRELKPYLEEFYKKIMSLSKDYQEYKRDRI